MPITQYLNLLFFLLCFESTIAQSSIPVWSKVDSILSSEDIIYDAVQLPDSGFVLAGSIKTAIAPFSDNLIVRTNKFGDTLWTKSWGSSSYESIFGIALRPGGGFVVVGNSNPNFIFLDSAANVTASFNYGSFCLNDVVQLPDSGFVFTGYTTSGISSSDIVILRVDKNGDSLWLKTYFNPKGDIGRSVITTTDGNFLIVGEANFTYWLDGPYSPQRAFIMKINPSGDTLWTDTIAGSISFKSSATDVLENRFGEYILTGNSSSSSGFIASYSSTGTLNWFKQFDNPYLTSGTLSLYSIEQKCDGGYLAVGNVATLSSVTKGLVISTSIAGDTIFTIPFSINDSVYQNANLRSIIYTYDGGYFCAGYTKGLGSYNSDSYLIKLDGVGGYSNQGVISSSFSTEISFDTVFFTNNSVGSIGYLWDFGDGTFSLLDNPEHIFAFGGIYQSCLTTWNYCDTVSSCDTIFIMPLEFDEVDKQNNIRIFPQPSSGIVTIAINSYASNNFTGKVFDLAGNELEIMAFNAQVKTGENLFSINLSKHPKGIYLLKVVFINGIIINQKIVIQ